MNKNDVSKEDIPEEILQEVQERVEPSLLASTKESTNNLLDRT